MCLLFYGCDNATIECKYKDQYFWNTGIKDSCETDNNPNIRSNQTAKIESITGHYNSIKYFSAHDKTFEYFPIGMEKFFSDLFGIRLSSCGLKELHQSDLKALTNLEHLDLFGNKLDVLEEGLFNSNPKLEQISFDRNYLIYIHSTVFDDLISLNSLALHSNLCINMRPVENNRNNVLTLVKTVKSKCSSLNYPNLLRKLNELDAELDTPCITKISTYVNKLRECDIAFNDPSVKDSSLIAAKIYTLTKKTLKFMTNATYPSLYYSNELNDLSVRESLLTIKNALAGNTAFNAVYDFSYAVKLFALSVVEITQTVGLIIIILIVALRYLN